ncbi:MAG TPA: hypothetical protein VIY49_13910 [Bryobacteraceae bacterium]
MMKLDGDERALLGSAGRGEWRSVKSSRRERGRYVRYARETFKKDRRVNIRI